MTSKSENTGIRIFEIIVRVVAISILVAFIVHYGFGVAWG